VTGSRRVDLSDVPVVDGHGHPLFRDPWTIAPEVFTGLFSEGRSGAMTAHIPHTAYFQRACRDLARRLGTEATVDALLERRRALGPEGARRLLAESGVAALLIDTGYPPEAMPLAEMRRALPCAVYEVFRIETCAQELLSDALSFQGFLDAFRASLRAAAARCVGFKSIIAYRSGLAVEEPDPAEAARAFERVVARVKAGGSRRLTEKPLLDMLFGMTLEIARETDRPLQVHCGFGDPDIDLVQANPLLLRPMLEDSRWAHASVVLLHLAYPYFREAAFMTAVWPEVQLDLSLAIPFLGPGAVGPLVEVLSLAPATKLLYGSDVGALPELFALSADWGRAALGDALGWLVEHDGMTESAAREAGRRILSENATALYRLK
jgi:predicted TIM-barrel fold metal-dependent hydrolase